MAVTEIVKRSEPTAGSWTPDQVELLKRTVCKGATDDELKLFMYVAQKSGLDPFAKQIHALKRKERDAAGNWRDTMSFQTGIDGYRLIAERTGRYEGQTKPEWCGSDGKWLDVWLSNGPPSAARVGVFRTGFRDPVWGIALYREYVQTTKDGNPNRMWSNMPANQLAKCAESLALRKAFPQELSGLYTFDEMGQTENEAPPRLRKVEVAVEDESQEPPNGAEDIEEAFPPLLDQPKAETTQSPATVIKAFATVGVTQKQLEDFLKRDLGPGSMLPEAVIGDLRKIYKQMVADKIAWADVVGIKAEVELT